MVRRMGGFLGSTENSKSPRSLFHHYNILDSFSESSKTIVNFLSNID